MKSLDEKALQIKRLQIDRSVSDIKETNTEHRVGCKEGFSSLPQIPVSTFKEGYNKY